ncbi:MAG: exodeoxyribonuclease III [Rickettsiales bacterium]|nr:exodeoxyribonuclease III [Rickettsiales bacterium]
MSKVTIASFNVNSINARLPNLLKWLKESHVDIVCLQELKCLEEKFPFDELLDAGYNAAVNGQKTYNGVAILSKFKIEEVVRDLCNPARCANAPTRLPLDKGSPDPQARYIECVIPIQDQVIRVSSIYVPNGGGSLQDGEKLEDSEKFKYKMDFFDRLNAHFKELLTYDEIQIFGGDYNVGAEEIDVYDPKSLKNTVCFHDLERQKFRQLLHLGLDDSFRKFSGVDTQNFSWWDYRGGSWQHNKGMRIDYLLTSPLASDRITDARIEDRGVRDQEKASDHCPVIVELKI